MGEKERRGKERRGERKRWRRSNDEQISSFEWLIFVLDLIQRNLEFGSWDSRPILVLRRRQSLFLLFLDRVLLLLFHPQIGSLPESFLLLLFPILFFVQFFSSFKKYSLLFLGATKHLYNWLCPLVGRSVGWSGNAFVRRSTCCTLLAYLALFSFSVPPPWLGQEGGGKNSSNEWKHRLSTASGPLPCSIPQH